MAIKIQYTKLDAKGIAEIRENAIDDFAEKLCDELCEVAYTTHENGWSFDVLTLDGATELVMGVAERMKNE
jgi:hypothetical protein